MDRRRFLGVMGVGISGEFGLPKFASALNSVTPELFDDAQGADAKAYGSGHFGVWITDSFGLPAYRYTCNQVSDPKAISPVHKEWRSPTDHTHQVGNNRIVAAVSNYGYVQVRQDEGSPKFLNDYYPEGNHFGAGIGYLSDGKETLSTFYSDKAASFERIMGQGYFQKIVKSRRYEIDQIIFAPFGDDPVLLSTVKLTNHGSEPAHLRWIEYWGAQQYQFSCRSWMEASLAHQTDAAQLRRLFAARFAHEFKVLPKNAGLLDTQKFLGRSLEDEHKWESIKALQKKNPLGSLGGPTPDFPPGVSMEDLNPPSTFLVSLDNPFDGFTTNASAFFGTGGVEHPAGLSSKLAHNLDEHGTASAFLLERHLELRPRESRTFTFLYGYLPEGFQLDALVAKYNGDPSQLLQRSSAAWKSDGVRFSTPAAPWAERETSWHNYYLRSSMTYDSFFREHIISQGHVYQYVFGFQGAARDPLQHTLPFIFSDPAVVRGVIRYTLKEIQPDGSIPYGIVGSGVPMPSPFIPSDQEMWLLWTTSEYVLATRDKNFLNEKVIPYPHREASPNDPTVRELLGRAYSHLVNVIGVGKHGIMRLAKGDWNDGVVVGRVPEKFVEEVHEQGESVLNAAMACYVLDYYSRMLAYIGDATSAAEAHAKAEAQRKAVQENWAGQWFKRAWLGPDLGWIGEDRIWLEPQPWAIIGGAATSSQTQTLVDSINELLRKPSPIGAMILSKGEDTPSKRPGILENGGIWPSINGTLIWALALVDGNAGWEEWKKNSLAMHAEAYPDIWYGIWSGPDTYNSILSKSPGQTMFTEPVPDGQKSQADWGLYWTDFPVMNMHPHAWPLYSSAKLLGLEFHKDGLTLQPKLPMPEYDFTSPLLGYKKSPDRITGWYAPAAAGRWEIELKLPGSELVRLTQLKINGKSETLSKSENGIHFSGESQPGAPLHWELS
jgi:Glycosyl hydrolase 36 superfamily, catalytic domain/Glycosyltransferase family 36